MKSAEFKTQLKQVLCLLCINVLRKGMNPSFLLPIMGKTVVPTGLFSFVWKSIQEIDSQRMELLIVELEGHG